MAGVKGMRTGGQNKKPAALHVLQGTWRKHRHGRRSSPEPPAGVPEPPGALSGESKAEWDRMIVRLTAAGTLSSVDAPLLWNYCQLWADGCPLQADANQLTQTWYSAGSEPKLHPVFAALKQYRLALRVYLVEFGLTPLARNRVTAHPAATRTPAMDPKKAKYFEGLTTK
jgi:P27 family predicted phage terminase small subunit